jgi:lipopolysaccharide/colanic/teichoic acid biosynthesis glycosyltransferase
MPVLLLVSVAIKFSSAGPIFFHQKRQGLNGQVFKMLKFRSMKLHDDSSYVQTQMNDTRITKIGGFLRKYSIDELPQLINVLRGDMSLVGPRPHALDINKKYKKTINKFMSRHKVRPGMTGLAQVKGYRGGDNLEDMKMRTFYDLKYINSWSLFLDIKILLKTIPALFEEKAY